MTSFADLPDLATSVVAAGDHLELRGMAGDFSCGCPGWAGHGPHAEDCPIAPINACLMAVGRLKEELGRVVAGSAQLTIEEVRVAVDALAPPELPAVALGCALALVGAARLAVNVEASRNEVLHDLTEPSVERYATLYRVCSDPHIVLGPQTAVRLLLSPHAGADLDRMLRHVDVGTGIRPQLDELTLPPLIVSILAAVHHILEPLVQVRASLDLGELATDGVNLLAGVPNPVRQHP